MAGTSGSTDIEGEDDVISGINVTPLVDVVLVLLIIFMITAPVIYQNAIKVQLPAAATGEANQQRSPIEFTISKEGSLFWGKDAVTWETLGPRLSEAGKASGKEQMVMITADEATPHGVVIKLMDAVRQAGLSRIAVNVQAPVIKK